MRMAECVIIQGWDDTQNCYSVFHYSRIGAGQKLLDFFPGKLYMGGILIFSIRQLLFTCIITVIKIHICRLYSVGQMCFFFLLLFFYEDVTCIVKDGSAVFAETWLEGWREEKQLRAKLLLELSHGDLLTQTVGSQSLWNQQHEILAWASERQPCEKSDFFFTQHKQIDG